MLPCFWQVSSDNMKNILNVLYFHFIELFRCQPFKVREGICLGRIVGILLEQFEEDCFAVEVADCVVKAELDFSSFMTLFVSVYVVRLLVIWNTRSWDETENFKCRLKLPTNRILPFSESSKLISRSPWPPSMTRSKLKSILKLISRSDTNLPWYSMSITKFGAAINRQWISRTTLRVLSYPIARSSIPFLLGSLEPSSHDPYIEHNLRKRWWK